MTGSAFDDMKDDPDITKGKKRVKKKKSVKEIMPKSKKKKLGLGRGVSYCNQLSAREN